MKQKNRKEERESRFSYGEKKMGRLEHEKERLVK